MSVSEAGRGGAAPESPPGGARASAAGGVRGPAGAPALVLLGCGDAARMHSRTLARVAPDAPRFYASRSPQRAAAASERWGGAGAFGSYAEALADPRPDVALVLTPPATHLELALAALGAGKHVIVEKPPFLGVAELDRAEAAARRAGRRLLVAENYFYKPLAERLRALVGSGALGEIRFVQLNALKWQGADGWRRDAAMAGGGALFEGGIHWIDLLANLGLTVARIRGVRAGPPDGPARSALVVADYEEGAVGTLLYSWEMRSPLRGLRLSRIYGTEGAAAFESNGLVLATSGRRRALRFPGLRDIAGYRAMFTDFLRALAGGPPARYTSALARRDLELTEQAERGLAQALATPGR